MLEKFIYLHGNLNVKVSQSIDMVANQSKYFIWVQERQ
jgi:hypothetical protein